MKCKARKYFGGNTTSIRPAFIGKNQLRPGGNLPVWVPRGSERDGFAARSIAKATAAGLTSRARATTAQDTLQCLDSLSKTRQAALTAG